MRTEPKETTLLDYLRSLRSRWPIVFVTAVVCAGAALALSLAQKPRYEATASLALQDPNAALALAGAGGLSTQTPLELASSHESQVTRQEVVAKVASRLRNRFSPGALRQAVSVSVDPNSALVDVTATAGTAADAAAIANDFANIDASLTTGAERDQYTRQARQLAKRIPRGPTADPSSRALYLSQLVRLQTLSSVAAPVQVNTLARVPGSPASPKPLRNTLAALIFGLLVGIGLAYARDVLDRRLRHAEDVEGVLEFPIIGAVGAEALGSAGASAQLAVNGAAPLSARSQESFRIIRQNVRYLAVQQQRSLLVTSAIPEEGKSTLAACLARMNAAAGKRTLLVECDLRRPVLAARLGLPDGPGLTDYLTGHASPTETVRALPSVEASSGEMSSGNGLVMDAAPVNLVCITAGTPAPRPAELLDSERFRTFMGEVTEAYDMVILDTAPLLTVADTLELVPFVDAMLLCVRLRQTTREQARGLRSALHRLPDRPVGIVLTGVREGEEGAYGYYGYYSAYASPAAAVS